MSLEQANRECHFNSFSTSFVNWFFYEGFSLLKSKYWEVHIKKKWQDDLDIIQMSANLNGYS